MSTLVASRASVTSAEFVRHFGVWQDRAASEPVVVTHHGRARLVLIAAQRYQELLDDGTGGGAAAGELRLAMLLDRLDACFIAIDRDRRIARMNVQAAGYLQVRRDSRIGHRIGQDMHDLAGPVVQRHLDRTLAAGEATIFDAPSIRYPGEWIRFQSFPFGEGAGLIFRNVTVEHALRLMRDARDSLASALAEHGAIGTGTINQRGRLMYADKTLATLAGRMQPEMRYLRLTDLLARDRAFAAMEEIEAMFAAGRPRMFESVLAGGTPRAVRVALAPLNGEYGIDGASVVMTPSI